MSQVNNAERIFDWAQQVMQVGFVQMINKKFAGLVLHDKRDAQAVVKVVDSLLEELTQIEDVTNIGLGVPLITVKESTQYQDGAEAERERIIKLLKDNIGSIEALEYDYFADELAELIKGENK